MLEYKDPSSNPNGHTFQSISLKRTFSSRTIPIMMQWSYLVLSKGFWFTMSLSIQAAHQISSLQKPSGRCKTKMIRYMMQHIPLCGFRGREILAHSMITMSITSGYVHNTRTEQVVFDIVDMEYPYNAIIGRGTLNAFEAILNPAYLYIKIPSDQGP
jgi:hypothetical protein